MNRFCEVFARCVFLPIFRKPNNYNNYIKTLLDSFSFAEFVYCEFLYLSIETGCL